MRKSALFASLMAAAANALAFGASTSPSVVQAAQAPASRHYVYSGGPGTARVKRAAAKRRNVLRNRRAHRG